MSEVRVVLGVECFAGRFDQAVDDVFTHIDRAAGGYLCLGNAHLLATAQRREDVRVALGDALKVYPDGQPVVWAARRAGAGAAERVAGADLMLAVIDRGRARGLRHYLFGSTPQTLRALEARIERTCPGAQVVGTYAPPFRCHAGLRATRVESDLRTWRPDVIWCALGAPKQELWMRLNAARLAPAVLIGVGAAFDFIAGTRRRAPTWLQRVGLEWSFRLAMEPRRLFKRYATTNTLFAFHVAREAVRR